jgi:hypothetical protein
MNGSIPIYYGPKLENFGIPGSKISLSPEFSADKLEKRIKLLSQTEIENYLNEMRNFIISKNFYEIWDAENVYLKIVSKIISYAENSFNQFYKN